MKFSDALATVKKVLTRGLWVLHCEYMHRSLPLAPLSVFRRQFSVLNRSGFLVFPARHTPLATRHSRRTDAFTLIELMVVVTIIAILAGLALSSMGYVNRKGAESRARSEVAALSAAIEAFKLDSGFYPPTAASLYTNLCPPSGTNKVYFEPPVGMATNNQFLDPWGTAYGYSNYTAYFELWSTAGGASSNNWIRN